MDEDLKKEIKKIIGDMQCPENFKCCKSGFEAVCKAKDVGLESHLVCLEENPFECPFSVSFGRAYYCHCPLRVYVAKKLRK
jgi:hypothetical protein